MRLPPICLAFALVLAVTALHLPEVRADEVPGAEWSAGVASVKITPDKPILLAGYASRTKPFEKVDQDIYAKALALADSKGHRAVLVTLDLCTLPRDVAEGMRSR